MEFMDSGPENSGLRTAAADEACLFGRTLGRLALVASLKRLKAPSLYFIALQHICHLAFGGAHAKRRRSTALDSLDLECALFSHVEEQRHHGSARSRFLVPPTRGGFVESARRASLSGSINE